MKNTLTFTELLREISATYPERSRAFHLVATRYYLGAETDETLAILSQDRPCTDDTPRTRKHWLRPLISMGDAMTIVTNR